MGRVSLLEPLRSERCPGVKENSWTLNCFRDFVPSLAFHRPTGWKCWYLYQKYSHAPFTCLRRTYVPYEVDICLACPVFSFFNRQYRSWKLHQGVGRSTPSPSCV